MEAPVRYSVLFEEERGGPAESFWISLRYFNLYRIVLALLTLGSSFVYGDQVELGAHSLLLFRYVAAAYLLAGVAFAFALRRRERFNLQLSLHACADVLAITLLMNASAGMRSGLGVMLLISLTGAALVAPRRLTYLYAALAAIALLLEQGYWVLVHDAPASNYLAPGLLAIGCFASAGVTSWLAQRVATNERLARERGRALETQMRISQRVIEDMHEGVLVLGRDGRVVQHNPQAQRLLGAEALLGAELQALVPGFAAAGTDGEADVEVRGRGIRLRRLEAGTDEFSVLSLEDTTRAREQAQQLKLAALGRLTANIAHEIRNPLSAIGHAAELLGEEKRDADRGRLYRIIGDNTRRLDKLVADVLQLSRRDRVAAERIQLGAWLRGFVAEFAANEGLDAGRCALEVARDAAIEFDREHLRQVLWNLLRNAVRHAPAAPGSVRLALRAYGDQVELNVIDSGPGVDAANQGQLFEPFFTTDSMGTGLGLYIARELCAANRAVLDYVDDIAGAHFRIRCREARAA